MHLYCSSTLYLQIIKSTPSAFQDRHDITILWPWLTVVTWIIFKSTLWVFHSYSKCYALSLFASLPYLHPRFLSSEYRRKYARGRTYQDIIFSNPLFYFSASRDKHQIDKYTSITKHAKYRVRDVYDTRTDSKQIKLRHPNRNLAFIFCVKGFQNYKSATKICTQHPFLPPLSYLQLFSSVPQW